MTIAPVSTRRSPHANVRPRSQKKALARIFGQEAPKKLARLLGIVELERHNGIGHIFGEEGQGHIDCHSPEGRAEASGGEQVRLVRHIAQCVIPCRHGLEETRNQVGEIGSVLALRRHRHQCSTWRGKGTKHVENGLLQRIVNQNRLRGSWR